MKKILLVIGYWLLIVGVCFGQTVATAKTKKTSKTAKSKTLVAKTLLKDTIKETISLSNTGIKIFLDSLNVGVSVDTTIKKGRRLTKYSFTPSVNTWSQTDTSYQRRYFLTIDVTQILTDNADDIITKNVVILDREIEEDTRRIQDKIRARNQALKLKSKN